MMMSPVRAWLLVVLCCAVWSCRAQTSEEDLKRPYSFGFTIENMQHRQEMKDSNGIITGEYGFVTADGWYRTTYYATDKDGKFKITGRKKTRVGPPVFPVQPAVTTRRPTTTVSTTTQRTPPPQPGGIPGCAGCIIPTTTPAAPSGFKPSSFRPSSPYPASSGPLAPTNPPSVTISSSAVSSSSSSSSSSNSQSNNNNQFSTTSTFVQQGGNNGGGGNRPSQVQGGQGDGVSGGLNYRFSYTAGYHGHQETGLNTGVKTGEYFVNTRDGIKHKVTYEADSNGFRPRISQVRIPPNETPQEDTEKLAGLKGYEFVWFKRR
ncbi:Hypothetical predicted protein [Cloeon dipterum]|uniref:Uncharacterized protein n=1 Tax=Cloeon dipterum TaxID=197152 RepID=A0A8S1E1E4_9INSE|nr:Hypothetical predicted protein [Cloeon dipterum]